jgi:peptide methionine sulfoxide reductase MsrA
VTRENTGTSPSRIIKNRPCAKILGVLLRARKGSQYRTAIFYHDEEQRALAEEDKNQLESSGIFDKPIVTEIRPYPTFYQAEDYHQDYYKKNVLRYNTYKELSGRPDFFEKYWNIK